MSWNPLAQPIQTTALGRIVKVLPEEKTGLTFAQLQEMEKKPYSPIGEGNHQAKLTAQKVLRIREAYAQGAKKSDLARLYCVSEKLIFTVVKRKAWKHV